MRLVHDSTLFYIIFDTYVEPGSALILKFEFSIGFENMGKLGVKSPCVQLECWRGRFAMRPNFKSLFVG